MHHLRGEFDHLLWKGGRKQQTLTMLRHVLLDESRIGTMPAFFHHVIGLVQHKYLDLVGLDRFSFQPFHDFAGRSDDHVGIDGTLTARNLGARDGQLDLQTRHVGGHGLHGLVENLDGQFAGWRDAKGLGRCRLVHLDAVQHSKRECCRLSATRLGLTDEIARRVGQDARQRLLLDRGRPIEAHGKDSIQQVLGKVELLECLGARQVRRLVALDHLQSVIGALFLPFQRQLLKSLGQFLTVFPLLDLLLLRLGRLGFGGGGGIRRLGFGLCLSVGGGLGRLLRRGCCCYCFAHDW
mmetsp:Transcript_21800/g.62065  ORF Transcript_21800/g.62065 Transcript_21800/m.62065 type:complete len:295 (+) Transcript_21800:631-1515(+)